MADNIGNSGIKADGYRAMAVLRKVNYIAWSSKSKVHFKVMYGWRLVSGSEAEPPVTAPPGAGSAGTSAALIIRA